MRSLGTIVSIATLVAAWTQAHAYEGANGQMKPGSFIGASAGAPPPGLYGFTKAYTYQSNVTGPVTSLVGNDVGVQTASGVQGFLYVPGWTLLGATYDAVLALPAQMASVGSPLNKQASAASNLYIVPIELSWNLANTGFFAKAGVGLFAPTGTETGPNGWGSLVPPYWSIQPEFFLSYLKDGWNLTAAFAYEMPMANSFTGYRSGDVLHADFTATKRIGKWTLGPVGYYVGQVTSDKTTSYYKGLVQNANKTDVWAIGGLIGYDFGTVSVSLWGAQEVYAKASGALAGPFDVSSVTKGFTLMGQMNYRIWAPDEQAPPKRPQFYK
ncbi:transporter [Bradyrhizobium neotropicale]|uniref:SphA family protein n=1 Tax=Bradyrhizobium neotropicale TaxID=1497615 RepID=UPI001AD7B588|nr:transporter [Bradyrhizobium neotropicale]MBO4225269.1 hypothetical protein [Bradyrhizobium neotropicale]